MNLPSSSTHAPQLGITVLRISLGAMWVAHALLKLFVFTLRGTAQYFASIGFPAALAYPLFAAELPGDGAAAIRRSQRFVLQAA